MVSMSSSSGYEFPSMTNGTSVSNNDSFSTVNTSSSSAYDSSSMVKVSSGLSEYESDSYSYDYIYEYPYSRAWLATVPLVLSIIICITVIGNFLVIAAFIRDRNVRSSVANLLILNLAVTDLLVGTFILTINTVWLVKDTWVFGEIPCKIWLTLDYVLIMMSVITMVLISWDRYCLVSMGMKYNTYQTRRRIGVILLVSWTTATTFFTLMAFTWSVISGESNVDYSYDCEMEFSHSLAATVVVNVIEFFIPLLFLVGLNLAVYLNIRRRSKGSVGQSPAAASISTAPASNRSNVHDSPRRTTYVTSQESAFSTQANGVSHLSANANEPSGSALNVTSGAFLKSSDQTRVVKKERRMFVRHRKAALVLGILVGCFLMCWLPYQVSSVMYAICGDVCVTDFAWEVTNTFLWCNSTINPFIYAATNVHFRRNFRQFLFLDHWGCDVRRCKCRCQRETNSIVITESGNDSLNS